MSFLIIEEILLDAEETTPNTSKSVVVSYLGMSRCSVQHILHVESLHIFHKKKVKLLFPNDQPKRLCFAQ